MERREEFFTYFWDGGRLESDDNLSHEGSCFVYNEGIACGCARIAAHKKNGGCNCKEGGK